MRAWSFIHIGSRTMNKIACTVALMIVVASVSPALATEFCLDRNSKLYRFLGEASHVAAIAHSPPAKGWAHIEAAAASAMVKAAAKDHFHVKACPGVAMSPELIEAIRRMKIEFEN
jgi:hypothetical protein